jgi:ubiquitin-conjugating enzyme E2 W
MKRQQQKRNRHRRRPVHIVTVIAGVVWLAPLLLLLLLSLSLLPDIVLGVSGNHRTSRPSSLPFLLHSKELRLLSRGRQLDGHRDELQFWKLRGGEISLPDDDNTGGLVVTKVRNIIRSILEFGDRKFPTVSGIFRSCFHVIEKVTGISLLPSPPSKQQKTAKSTRKKTKSSVATGVDEGQEEEEPAKTKSKKKSKGGKAKVALKKPSATTKSHLSASMKSTNPNYRIQKELKEFIESPPENLSVQVGSNIRIWVVTMVGAKNSIYEGEVYKLRISFPKDYPTVPPSVYFLKGYIPTHEHVYTNGDICLSLLGKDWRPTMTAQSIAVSILSILSSAKSKALPMDNANHANAKPGQYQENWVYHDDNC